MNTDLINLIKKFDLTTYEAKVYISLNSLIRATAEEIASEANIPKSKTYDVLKNLNKKNFIEIKGGKPIIYEVIPPQTSFKNHRQKLIKELREAEKTMIEIYENNVSQIQAPIWLIPKEENILKKESELIKTAENSIAMRIGFLNEKELEKIIKKLKKTSSKVQIKILAKEKIFINNKEISIIERFEKEKIENLQIEKSDIPFVRLIIKDKKEMFHIYAKKDKKTKEPIPSTYRGVWNRYDEISKNYYERFEKQFNEIQKNKKS